MGRLSVVPHELHGLPGDGYRHDLNEISKFYTRTDEERQNTQRGAGV